VQDTADSRVARWLTELAERHTANLEFAELRRGVQALNLRYVGRRDPRTGVRRGTILDGAGKRAAFALYYAPLHFLAVRRIADELGLGGSPTIVDLGCGTGATGAAVAWSSATHRPFLLGVDSAEWAVRETRWNWRALGLDSRVVHGDATRPSSRGMTGATLVAGYLVNELDATRRERLLTCLLRAADDGSQLLVVEPIARRLTPWWDDWAESFRERGGRADIWRLPIRLPDLQARLAQAAGLGHDELTARSLAIVRDPAPGVPARRPRRRESRPHRGARDRRGA